MTNTERNELHRWAIESVFNRIANHKRYGTVAPILGPITVEENDKPGVLAYRGDVVVNLVKNKPVERYELECLLDILSYFGCPDDDYDVSRYINGKSYSVGDGDDGGAVYFMNGVIRIWLRGWDEAECPTCGNAVPAGHTGDCPTCHPAK